MFYEKHKIFLYKEDFEKFTEGLRSAIDFIGNGKYGVNTSMDTTVNENAGSEVITTEEFTNINFDDLGKK